MKKNFHQRIAQLKKVMAEKKLKKSGKNSFSNYSYFELDDFLTEALAEAEKLNLLVVISIQQEQAILTCYDCEQDNYSVSCSIPTENAKANLKGCHEVQNLGAVVTYLRRYLWTMFLDICEHDALDAVTGKPEIAPAPKDIRAKIQKNCLGQGRSFEKFIAFATANGIDVKDDKAITEFAKSHKLL